MYSKEELLKINDDYERALSLIKILFKDITDKEGKPYINHLIRVSNNLENKNTKTAGLLHDVLEDIEYMDEEKLNELNFNNEIISLIKIVTNTKKDKSYSEYITSVLNTNNIEAIKIKYADMSDNFNKERLNKLSENDKERLTKKYEKEIIRIKDYLIKVGELNE